MIALRRRDSPPICVKPALSLAIYREELCHRIHIPFFLVSLMDRAGHRLRASKTSVDWEHESGLQ